MAISSHKYRRRMDTNQPEIVKGLREAGYEVTDYHGAGNGIPDLLVTRHENNFSVWVECKRRGGVLTGAEIKFFANCYSDKIIAFDRDDAVAQVQALEERHKEKTW